MRQIGMGEGFGLVAEQEHDVARLGLCLEQLSAQARPVHGVRILAALQRGAGAPPPEAPFFLRTTDTRAPEVPPPAREMRTPAGEMRTPARGPTSSAQSGSAPVGRPAFS